MSKENFPMPYWKQRQQIKLKATHSNTESQAAVNKKEKKKEAKVFYANQALKSPANCEECKVNLQATINFHPRGHICHIVPKNENGCPSVSTHPLNRWFGCLDCHTNYDNDIATENFESIEQMNIFPKLLERVSVFYHLIPANEKRRVPEIFIPKNVRPTKNRSNKKN